MLGTTPSIISAYLSSGTQTNRTGEAVFPRDDHTMAQIRRIRLLNGSGRVASSFSCDETITIMLLLEVYQQIPGMYCWLDLSKHDGTMVMMSDSFDSPPNPLDHLPVGAHEISIAIPPRTLGHGDYNVTLVFTGILGGATPVDGREAVCSFVLNDTTSKRGDNRPGFLSVLPHWEVRQLKSAAGASSQKISPTAV